MGLLYASVDGREELSSCTKPLFAVEGGVVSSTLFEDVLNGFEIFKEGDVCVVGFVFILRDWDVEVDLCERVGDLEGGGTWVRSSTNIGVKTEMSKKNGFAALCSSMSNVAMFGDEGFGVLCNVGLLSVLFTTSVM